MLFHRRDVLDPPQTPQYGRANGSRQPAKEHLATANAQVARKQEEYMIGPMSWSRIDAAGVPAQTIIEARAAITRS